MSAVRQTHETVRIPEIERGEVQVRAETVDEAKRTVDIIWAAGAQVVRYDWWEGEQFIEELSMTPQAIRMDRFNNGMSFVDAHSTGSMESRLGVVVPGSVRIVGGLGLATIQFSRSNPLADSLFQDLRDGMPFPVSVGYKIHAYERTEASETSLSKLTAVDWEPFELSAVPIPADAGAHSRSADTPSDHQPLRDVPVTANRGNEVPMSQTTNTAPSAPTASPDALAERERIAQLRAIAARGKTVVTEETLSRAIDRGVTVEAFRAEVQDRLADRDEAIVTFPHRALDGGGTDASRGAELQSKLVDVLAGRASNGGAIARQFLEAAGVRTATMGDREIGRALTSGSSIWNGQIRGMHTSADFAMLVGSAASAVLLERFRANPSVLKRFSRLRNAVDFRDQRFYRPGEAPALLKVSEAGEIRSGTLSEESNGYRIETFGRLFALSFQASVNDGLGAFADFLTTFAESATQLEGDLFAQLLDGNGPRLDDGVPLFDATHGNLAAVGSAPTIESVSEGVLAMRTQRNVNGNAYAGTAPTALLVGPKLELKAKQLTAAIAATDAANVNPHALEVVVEDRFGRDFGGWFLLADPARRPAFIHGGLESEGEAPKVDSRDGWNVLGTEFRVVHHFGAGVHDHRAIYFNPGE